MKQAFECEYCGNIFYRYVTEKHPQLNAKFCSVKCHSQYKIEHRPKNATCAICGKQFYLKPYALKQNSKRYCSQECLKIGQKIRMTGEGNHQFGLKGDKNASWKSDRRITNYGYIKIRVLDHPFKDSDNMVFEHRLIAEKYLLDENNSIEIDGQKYLKKDYVVHHLNFNKQDNRVENLQVMTVVEHQHLHNVLKSQLKDVQTGRYIKSLGIYKPKRTTLTSIIPTKIRDDIYKMYIDSNKEIIIHPNEYKRIITHELFDIPENQYGSIYWTYQIPKEDLFTPYTWIYAVDSLDKGDIEIPFYNDTDHDIVITPHANIACIVFLDIMPIEFEEVDEFEQTGT